MKQLMFILVAFIGLLFSTSNTVFAGGCRHIHFENQKEVYFNAKTLLCQEGFEKFNWVGRVDEYNRIMGEGELEAMDARGKKVAVFTLKVKSGPSVYSDDIQKIVIFPGFPNHVLDMIKNHDPHFANAKWSKSGKLTVIETEEYLSSIKKQNPPTLAMR